MLPLHGQSTAAVNVHWAEVPGMGGPLAMFLVNSPKKYLPNSFLNDMCM